MRRLAARLASPAAVDRVYGRLLADPVLGPLFPPGVPVPGTGLT
jgi:hypothetical protein